MNDWHSKITTKRGDDGGTSSLSGADHSKCDITIECVGTVDELRAHLAKLRLTLEQENTADCHDAAAFVLWLMNACFIVGACCSDPVCEEPKRLPVELGEKHIARLEAEQGKLEARLRFPKGFVVGASSLAAAEADLACTVARRLERKVVALLERTPDCPYRRVILPFLNRLSDYLFVLARHLDGGENRIVDYTDLE